MGTLPEPPADLATIYVRLSKQASATNLSREGMVRDCRELAERHGLTVYKVHIDDGISGAVRDRPALRESLADIETCRAGVLVSWHTDRLTREGISAAAMFLDCIEGKDSSGRTVRQRARLLTVDGLDSHDEEAFRWRFVIAAEVARSERNRIVARNRAARERLTAEGRWANGPAPFGCRLVPNPGGAGVVLGVEETEAEWLRKVADRLLTGASVLSCAQYLNTHGVRPRRAARWSPTALTDTMRAAADRGIVFGPAHSAMLRERLDPQQSPKPRKGITRLLARGGIVCSSCGSAMTVGGTRTAPQYRCPSAANVKPCDRPVYVRADRVDALVECDYLRTLGAFERFELAVTSTGDAELDAAQVEVDEAKAQLLSEMSDAALQRLRAATEALDKAKLVATGRRERWTPTGVSVREWWDSAPLEDRARALRDALAGPVVVLPAARRGRSPEDWSEVVRARLVYRWKGVEEDALAAG